MDFHLEFHPPQLSIKINHHKKLFLIGSCFTENIGEKLLAYKFSVLQNPNGILFNPISVCNALSQYIDNPTASSKDLFLLNECYHSWDHHSRFSAPKVEDAVSKINQEREHAHEFLKNADVLLLTLGSAWVYELTKDAVNKNSGYVAANNHKAPSNWFTKRLMDTEEIKELFQSTIHALQNFNPNLEIIFTISPVRHLREGFIENNRSKAALISAIHSIVETTNNVAYFPAYELVIDDLRDYRFYAEDLVHPNYAATNYVWEKFVQVSMEETTKQLMKQIADINIARKHKPFHAESVAHQNFLNTYCNKIKQLINTHPEIDFSDELVYFTH